MEDLFDDASSQSGTISAMLSPPLSPFPEPALLAARKKPLPLPPIMDSAEYKRKMYDLEGYLSPAPLPVAAGATASEPVAKPAVSEAPVTLEAPASVTEAVSAPVAVAVAVPDKSAEPSVDGGAEISKDEQSQPKSNPQPSSGHLTSSNCYTLFNRDPALYRRRELEYMHCYAPHHVSWARQPTSSDVSFPSSRSISEATVLTIERAQASTRAASRAAAMASSVPSLKRRSDDSDSGMSTRSRTAGSGTASATGVAAPSRGRARVSTPRVSRPSTPKPKKPRVASQSPAPSRVHDLPYEELEDYAPPVDSLPPGKSLKAEWKGAPMDLSSDPKIGLLHPAEIHLASVLRLSADLYIDSKRRLFAEKVYRLKHGLPFRRTDSQKACRIDVNKASRLFSAFERVGWLDDEVFAKYLQS